jgi:protein dithiol:quinone oxidoreductase
MARWRVGFFALFLVCVGMLGFALYHQFYQWLMPCLLCVYERMIVIVLGLLSLLAVIWQPATRRGVLIFSGFYALIALWGAGITVWHLLIQFGPKESAVSCASSLPFPIDLNALPSWISAVIRPVGDCSVVDFTLFGMSMPFWLLITFIAFLLPLSLLARNRLVEIRRRGL